MSVETIFGLNTLDQLFRLGLESLSSDSIRCMTYSANLDYVVGLFDLYPGLNSVVIYANNEQMTHSGKNTDRIVSLVKEKRLQFHHLSANQRVLHAKAYGFHNGDDCVLMGIGSPNLTRKSNQSIEVLALFSPPIPINISSIWKQISSVSQELARASPAPPPFVFQPTLKSLFQLDPMLVEDLWEHQKVILDWLSRRQRGIVNIPPGTGKTTIGLAFMRHLAMENNDLTTIVLVPTLTLMKQWLGILRASGIEVFEGGTEPSSYTEYLGAPEQRVLVTLYKRFWNLADYIGRELSVVGAPCLLLADECHHLYHRLRDLFDFVRDLERSGLDYYHVGLSATIDTFHENLKEDYLSHCGGTDSQFDISLPSFYMLWNELNERPILKEIEYEPHLCRLTEQELERYKQLSKYIAIQSGSVSVDGKQLGSAAIQRAMFVRGTQSGIRALRSLLNESIEIINSQSSLIFVQTNELASEIRRYVTKHPSWNPNASAYIYDSHQTQKYLDYAMEKFRASQGFCLISERMLAEGFDLPSISLTILHGSHRSERDWIQKIGRAIRYDPNNPDETAKIIDIVFCDPSGKTLDMELERHDTLSAISIS